MGPKTKGGGDAMIKTPCVIPAPQLEELKIAVTIDVAAEEAAVESVGVDEARMTEIQQKFEELDKTAPPTQKGKPTPEQLQALKEHGDRRKAYEMTLSKEELEEAMARGFTK